MLTLSYHAKCQSRERFPKVDIHAEIKDERNLVEVGGQREKSKAYLTKSGLVLIVEGGTVITVYSKQMYFGNVAAKVNLDLSAMPVKRVVDNIIVSADTVQLKKAKKKKQKKQEKKVSEEHIKQLQEKIERENKWLAELSIIVDRHATQYSLGYDSRKDRHAELKSLGYSCRAIDLYNMLYNKKFNSLVFNN